MRMAAFWPTRSPTGEVVKVGFGSRGAVRTGYEADDLYH
jgi:hypothetical protein